MYKKEIYDIIFKITIKKGDKPLWKKILRINGTLNLILNELKNKNSITQKELAEKTGISLRTIKRNIDILKESGYIEREGSKKTGHWKILKNIE